MTLRERIKAALDEFNASDIKPLSGLGSDARELLPLVLAELERLETALKPFADFAESFPPIIAGVHRDTDDTGVALSVYVDQKTYLVTFGDFRRANSAAGSTSGEKEE